METSVISASIARSVFRGRGAGTGDDGPEDVSLAGFVTGLERRRARSGEALSAWSAGEALPLRSLGVLGDAIGRAPTLGSALRCFVNGIPLVQSNTALSMEIRDDRVRVGYRILDPEIWPRRADAELTLAMILQVCVGFGVNRQALLDLGVEHEADGGTQAVARHNRTETACGEAENYLVLPARCLSLRRTEAGPMVQADGRSPDAQLSDHLRHLPVSRRVRQKILHRIGQGSIGQPEIAQELNMSERTLRRSLAAEGTCFHDIRDEVRRSMALALLNRPALSQSDVALSLGYSDQTAFSRAFSRWFGAPPSRHCTLQ